MRVVLCRDAEIVREVLVDQPIVIVGRDPLCDIVVDDVTVSKRHLQLELRDDGTLEATDLASRNGMSVNGFLTGSQAVGHLDLIQLGNHKLYVFDDDCLPEGPLRPETTVHNTAVHAASTPLEDTQPTPLAHDEARAYGLRPLGEDPGALLRLDRPNVMIGPAGHSALVMRRRDAMFLSRLSKETLRLNDVDVGPGSYELNVDDVVQVGPESYRVVAIGAD